MFSAGIITLSDKGFRKERKDESGLIIKRMLMENNYKIEKYVILPDEEKSLIRELQKMADNLKLDIILTTGGTGFSKRDITPEATLKVINRPAPGIAEAIRYNSLKITKRAMLSRGVSGIRNNTLIINLPGSPKAVIESLEYIIDTLEHGLKILTGQSGECAT